MDTQNNLKLVHHMNKERIALKRSLRLGIIAKCNNRCCICQTPFIVIHHIDGDPSNNDLDNLAPLCPNCHSQAHSTSDLTTNLTPSRIKLLRDKWYEYCEKRKEGANISPNAILTVKNFVRSVGFAQYGWAKTFSALDPSYEKLTVDEIINRVFSTTNRDDIVTNLETMKYMYQNVLSDEENLRKFKNLCNAFGVDYDELS
jgi:hypothetical protein